MKNRKITNAAIMLISFAFIALSAACDSGKTPSGKTAEQTAEEATMKDVKREVADAAETILDYTIEQRDAALTEAKKQIDDLDARIDKMENRIDENWDQMTMAARKKSKATLSSLRVKRNKVSEWYGGLKDSSVDAWKDMKKGFSDAYKDLRDSFEKAKNEF